VRILLTLMILLIVAVQMLSGEDMSPLWVETLLITLAHYFTSRRFINLPTKFIPDLEKAGYLEPEINPLYLPRHSIRIIIVSTFFFVGATLFLLDQMNPISWMILAAVIPYLAGIVFKAARACKRNLTACHQSGGAMLRHCWCSDLWAPRRFFTFLGCRLLIRGMM
jgi:hypothetical protein